MGWLAWRSHPAVLLLVLLSCGLGYVYQGPPFRLGYQGLGEPLCWLAFGPVASSAALLVLAPAGVGGGALDNCIGVRALGRPWPPRWCCFVPTSIRWRKTQPMASAHRWCAWGPARAAALIPWFVGLTLTLEWLPVALGHWPPTALLSGLGLPAGWALIRLMRRYHNQPQRTCTSKFLALRFQAWNGLGLALGLALAPLWPLG
jgi:1,4-dihydroxy-2-naphthoate octaprenyltransferase